jgi:signal transduction histidine kinase
MRTLLQRTINQLTLYLVVSMILCAPLFYFLTTRYYAEDLIEVIEEYEKNGKIGQHFDIEKDVVAGLMIQYVLIAGVIAISVIITTCVSTKKLWQPFDNTLSKIRDFKLGKDEVPLFLESNILEFQRLNESLTRLLQRDINSYRVQKEFTENASHELQTPIAIIRSDLDLLLQEQLNEHESQIVDNMYETITRMERQNKNLLLLAKIGNNQYEDKIDISITDFIQKMMPQYRKLYSCDIHFDPKQNLTVNANQSLTEIMISNLTVNAMRNSQENTPVTILIEHDTLTISNLAANAPLNQDTLFSRFNHSSQNKNGHGLGLAIVKQICEYHHWDITYSYNNGIHTFKVSFPKKEQYLNKVSHKASK